MSSLRGEINALEIQIDGLKRELQVSVDFPLEVYDVT